MNNLIQEINFKKSPHLLVAGATGSGKSVTLNNIIFNLMKDNNNRFVLIDPKRVEFYHFKNSPLLYNFKIIEDVNESIEILEQMIKMLDYRFTLLKNNDVKDIYAFNESKEENEKMNEIYICIDELSFLILQDKKKINDLLSKISMLGRAAGIHLICATQRPDREIISGRIQANFTTVLGLKVRNKIESRIIVGNNDLLNLEIGTAIISNGLQYSKIKIDMIQETEIKALIDEQIKNYKIVKPVTTSKEETILKTSDDVLEVPTFTTCKEEKKEVITTHITTQSQPVSQLKKKSKLSLAAFKLKILNACNKCCYMQ